MRRKRNEFMYEATASDPTDADLQQARRDVSLLLSIAKEVVARLV